jgi:hypothetical protein
VLLMLSHDQRAPDFIALPAESPPLLPPDSATQLASLGAAAALLRLCFYQ